MENTAVPTLQLPTRAPLMVLPGLQLFPQSLLPLFIFEPRYRAMLAWSLEQDRMFCLAPMKRGLNEAHSTDDFHHIVGLGLIRACVGHEDGTSHLVLQGLARVRFDGFVQETPFRIAQIRELVASTPKPAQAAGLMAELRAVCAAWQERGITLPEIVEKHLAEGDDPAALADILAQTVVSGSEHRQKIFEQLDVAQRVRMLVEQLTRELADRGEGS